MSQMRFVLACALLGGMAMSHANAAGIEPEVALNRQWAEQCFSGQAGGALAGHSLTIAHEDVAGDTKVNRCAFGGPIRLADRIYARGIGVNSHAVLRVSLQAPAKRFRAIIGLDRNVDNTAASVRFHVAAGGKDLFATEVIKAGAPPREIDVPLAGAREIDLVVDDGGDGRGWDQGDWADARFLLEDGTEVWLDDLARQGRLETGIPFSFVYGGKPSSEFLAGWKREVADEKVSDAVLRRTLTLTDPATNLEVKAVCTLYTDTAGADWTLHFTNRGKADTPPIEQVKAVDAAVRPAMAAPVVVHRLNGAPSQVDDWMPFDQQVAPGARLDFAATNGRSANVCPFFNVDWGGAGVITAIGWSGQWAASVAYQEGRLSVQAGMQSTHLVLHPGESIRSPRILQLYWTGGDVVRSYNLFRRTMMAHVMPRLDGKLVLPPIAHLSTSFYEMNGSSEANVLSHLESAKGLGFEIFWLDAYWTGPNGFPNSMGNYALPLERVEPRDRFPRGLKAIGEEVAKAGLGFLMWFEPERVAPGTHIAKEHPEWVISPAGDGSGLFDLGIPEAREYMTQYLNAAIREYRLKCLRIDYNIDPLGYWEFLDKKDPNRAGMGQIRYVEGVYRMWDDLLTANPGLYIDNCASGGRRIDLEACSRSIPLWRSDNTCDMVGDDPNVILMAAVKNQLMSAGLNRYVPYSTVGQMGAAPYFVRSGFNGGIAFAQDTRPKDYPRELLRQGIAEGKRLRKYWLGDFYPLSEATANTTDWVVLQYDRPEASDGIVVAFRRHRSPYTGYQCRLHAIDPKSAYEVTLSHTYAPEKPVRMKGEDLERLSLVIADCPGSVLVEYRRVEPTSRQSFRGRS